MSKYTFITGTFPLKKSFFLKKKNLMIFYLAKSTRRGQNKDFENFCDTTPLKTLSGRSELVPFGNAERRCKWNI